ncbi:dodecin family protein, partial [Mesorhizobium prunaredense]
PHRKTFTNADLRGNGDDRPPLGAKRSLDASPKPRQQISGKNEVQSVDRIKREEPMSNSVYKIIELVGTSTKSWDDAARAAVERASSSLRDLRIAEVVKLDLQIKDGKVEAYRAKVSISFKYEDKA